MKVFATASQGDSLPSTVISTTMPADTCQNGFRRNVVPDLDVDIVVPPVDNDDDQPPVDKDDAITYIYNDGTPPSDDDQSPRDKDGLKLKVEKIDTEFNSDEEKSKQYGYGVLTGVVATLGVVTLIAAGIFAYFKANQRN